MEWTSTSQYQKSNNFWVCRKSWLPSFMINLEMKFFITISFCVSTKIYVIAFNLFLHYIKLVIGDYLSYKRLFIRQGILKSVLKLTVDTVVSLDCLVQCNVIRNVINKFMKWIISSFSFDREETGGTWTIKWWKGPHNILLNTTSWLWIFDLSSTKNYFLPLNRKRSCLRAWSMHGCSYTLSD